MNILFVSSTRIGDAVLSTGLLAHLATTYPKARFTVACGPLPAPIFSHAPGVDNVIELHKRRWVGHWLVLWAETVAVTWDQVIDLRGSAFAWTLRAKARHVYRRGESTLHRVDALGHFLKLDTPPVPKIWLSDVEEAFAIDTIPDGMPVLALGPTANWAGKIWPADRFAKLVSAITAKDGILPDARIAVFGGAEERGIAAPLLEAIPSDRCIDLVGRVGILEAAACLKQCDMFIGNDSGLMHIAAATGTPTLGLFGPSQSIHYAPWGDHCAVAETEIPYAALVGAEDFDHRTTGSLMTSLSVERVTEAARALWLQRNVAS